MTTSESNGSRQTLTARLFGGGNWIGCGGRIVPEWSCPRPRWMPDQRYGLASLAVFDLGLEAGPLAEAAEFRGEYGYKSLVGMNLTTSMVALLMTWSASRWRPQSFTRRSGTRSLIHFGANLAPAGNFFYTLARGRDGLLIGRLSTERFYSAFVQGHPPCSHVLWNKSWTPSRRYSCRIVPGYRPDPIVIAGLSEALRGHGRPR